MCCIGFDGGFGSRCSGVCLSSYAVGVSVTGVKEINGNTKTATVVSEVRGIINQFVRPS